MNIWLKVLIIILNKSVYCDNIFEQASISERCAVTETSSVQIESVPQQRQHQRNVITIEIGVYYDIYLRQKFNNNDKEVEDYVKVVLTGAQTVFRYPSMRTRIDLLVTRLELVPERSVPFGEDLLIYYNNFCEWQWKRMKGHPNYDLAIMLTSKTLFYGHKADNNGYAPIARLCQPVDNRNDSCALIKVTYVNSMWTVAHEIGHKIGIYHDREGCEPYGVMSPVHEKPFHWTDCSNKDLDLFVANKTLSECLSQRSGQPLKGWDLNSKTFHSYSMDDQCSINFGPMYKVYQGPFLTKVCQSLPCIYDLVYPINAGRPSRQLSARIKL